MKEAAREDARTANLVCGYCSTGCALEVRVQGDVPVLLTPARDYPVNLGMACPKGWEALAPLAASDRGTTPLLRDGRGTLQPVDWDRAMQTFCRRFKEIQAKHGKSSVAFLGTGQIVSEELAFLGALTKFGMGLVHGDGNTRQCMATAVVAYKEAFGFDAPPYTYADFEESDVIVLVGSNLCVAHPIMWERICRNRRSPEIIVVDPRKTETAMAATQHYPLAPKSDLVLFYGLARILIERGWIDRGFIERSTSGFDGFARHVEAFTLERTAEASGLGAEELLRFAETIHRGERVSFWWTMGVNQSHEGVRLAQAIIALALMTGNLGRPGTGANSITGQCNAMGSRLFSNTTSLFGGRDFKSARDREAVARVLDLDVDRIPAEPSWSYERILEGVLQGAIRGLWIVATNPSHSWINQNDARDILDRLDFLVVQDMYPTTETAAHAHLYLPAASWGEKEGTFINSERRVGLVRKIARAPGQALDDFSIFRLVAHYWGCESMFRRWSSPEATFEILKELSRGQPCDITGIAGYQMLERSGGVQWPLAEGEALRGRERRLFEDGRFHHADGRARFVFEAPRPLPEATCRRYPFTLLTGRGTSSQWHTQTRTKKSAVLRKLYPQEIYAELNPDDALALEVRSGDWIRIASRRGEVDTRVHLTHAVRPGQIFVPMHYDETNKLTFPAFDPYSRQPSYKACAVSLERIVGRGGVGRGDATAPDEGARPAERERATPRSTATRDPDGAVER